MKSLLVTLFSSLIALFPGHSSTPNFGAAVPSTPALIDTYLASNIAQSDTSMVLANGTTRAGTALSGYMCFVIDVNTPTVEYVCGTASSTSVTSLSRGIDVTNPNSTSSALAYAHRRFASVQISDYPTLQFLVRKMNGTDTLDSPLAYSSTAPSFITSAGQLTSKGYVDAQVVAGASPIATNQAGIGLLATTASTSQGIATGTYNSTTYNLLPANSIFNATSSATTLVPVTKSNGKISTSFIDLSGYSDSLGSTVSVSTSLSLPTATSTATSSDAFNFLPAGTVQLYASSSAPAGWLLADGSFYATSSYPRLFSVIGYTFGSSTQQFAVPDMRGRFASAPSSTLSTTIGATGGSLTATGTASVTALSTTQQNANDGAGARYAFNSTNTGVSNGTASVTATPPYLILNYIIKY